MIVLLCRKWPNCIVSELRCRPQNSDLSVSATAKSCPGSVIHITRAANTDKIIEVPFPASTCQRPYYRRDHSLCIPRPGDIQRFAIMAKGDVIHTRVRIWWVEYQVRTHSIIIRMRLKTQFVSIFQRTINHLMREFDRTWFWLVIAQHRQFAFKFA